MTKGSLIYVDIGIVSGKDYWDKLVVPSVEEFQTHRSVHTGMAAASSLWHVHEWIWYDQHPDINSWGSKDYKAFCAKIVRDCPELEWLQDLTNIGKHRGLTRPISSDVSIVKQSRMMGRGGAGGYGVNAPMVVGSGQPQFCLYLRDGSFHWLEDVCKRAFDYWKKEHFP
jgi:hypothetical protein